MTNPGLSWLRGCVCPLVKMPRIVCEALALVVLVVATWDEVKPCESLEAETTR